MAIRKNKKFIDPRYFMDEKTERLDEAISEVATVRPSPVYADDFLRYLEAYGTQERYKEALRKVIKNLGYRIGPDKPIKQKDLQDEIGRSEFAREQASLGGQYQGDNRLSIMADAMWNMLMKRDPRVLQYIDQTRPKSRKRTLDDITDIVPGPAGPRPDHPFYNKE